jgi:hypothetical protein
LHPNDILVGDISLNSNPLIYYYYDVLGNWDSMNEGYTTNFQRFGSFTVEDYIESACSEIWLFYNFPVDDFIKKLAAYLIKSSFTNLSTHDYVILFYISLQEPEFKESLEGVPLPLLHDIFNPIIKNNINIWISQS